MQTRGQLVGAMLITFSVAACSSVTAPIGRAPGLCAQAKDFAFVGETTLRALAFDMLVDDPDYMRRGRFWATVEAIEIPMPSGAASRPPARMLCVEWLDGRDAGMETMSIPDDWVAPPN